MADENKSLNFDKGLFVIYISALFYLCAFGYKSGYFSNYRIPANCVEFDFSSLLTIANPILGVIVFVVFALNYVFMYFPRKDTRVRKGFLIWGVCLPLFFICTLVFGWENWKVYLLIFLGFLSIEFLLPAFRYKSTGLPYWERHNKIWSRAEKPSPSIIHSDFEYWFINKFGRAFYLAFWSLYVCPSLFSLYGQNIAAHETNHSVIMGKTETMIIDIRGSEMICKPFNREKKTFDNVFYILKETDYSNFLHMALPKRMVCNPFFSRHFVNFT